MLIQEQKIPEARPYQAMALDLIRGHYASGTKRVLLHMATGGGKTYIFSRVLHGAMLKGKRAVMAVKGKDLVHNASDRLFKEGIDHGCMQANHWNNKPNHPIQICSIDTLFSRQKVPSADLVVIDECHLANTRTFRWFVDQYPEAFFLPVSATPHHKKGLRHLADVVVYPITIKQLIEQGYLVPPRYYIPTVMDFSSVRLQSGEYVEEDVFTMMDDAKVYGDVIKYYRKHLDNQPAVCFAINVSHSKILRETFNRNGIPAEHLEADTPLAKRQEVLAALKAGDLKVVTNVGILTTGVDMPYLRGIIMCRPTKSYNLYIQMMGRGTRPYPEKDFFVVLDHANNIKEHGLIENERLCNLNGVTQRTSLSRILTCEKCFFTWERDPAKSPEENRTCPLCLHVSPPESRGEKDPEVDVDIKVELKEIKSAEEFEYLRQKGIVDKFINRAIKNAYKPGWVYYRLKDKIGEPNAKKFWKYITATVPDPGPRQARTRSYSSFEPTYDL